MFLGSTAPVGTLVHVPSVFGSAHDLHAALHVVEQHTPWAHTFDAHSLLAEQLAPGSFKPHELPLQTLPAEQFVLAVHASKQRAPLQAKGTHDRVGGVTHCPVALHVAAGV
jgi:hypothetical protein